MQRRPRRHHEKHLRFVRERGCLICGSTPVDAHHIKFADARVCKPQSSNIGMKADDRFVLPLCPNHHMQAHKGERAFFALHHVDAVLIALALFSVSGDGEEADRLLMFSRPSRFIGAL
jgi:hypothetical protein